MFQGYFMTSKKNFEKSEIIPSNRIRPVERALTKGVKVCKVVFRVSVMCYITPAALCK